MSDNQKNQLLAASTTRATPKKHYPKIIDVCLTDPPREPLQKLDQAEKWAKFLHALTSDERWSVLTGNPCPRFPTPFAPLEPVPDLELVPTTSTDQRCDTCWAEAGEKTRLTREILLKLGFVDISGVWNPRIRMQWGFPDRKWVEKNIPRSLESGISFDENGKVQTPEIEWLEYILGPAKMRRERIPKMSRL